MDNQNKDGRGSEQGPKQFYRITVSQDRKWLLFDAITRHFIHVNYMGAVLKNRAPQPGVQVETPVAPAAPGKNKRARKENDRTS